jgi:hypothetical protein
MVVSQSLHLFQPRVILDESGQSLIEFVLMCPLLAAILLVLIRINTIIQVSIVNQQYARAQTHFLTFNSPVYPAITHRSRLIDQQSNRMIMGVSDNTITDEDEGADYAPEASVQMIARTAAQAKGKGPDHEEPKIRGYVRVRNTVALCTQMNVYNDKGHYAAIQLHEGVSPSAFAYCRSPLDE